jgi:hypothetical protein
MKSSLCGLNFSLGRSSFLNPGVSVQPTFSPPICRFQDRGVGGEGTEAVMRYKPKSSAALHIALGGLPAQCQFK